MVIIMPKNDDFPLTRKLIVHLYDDAKKKRKAAETRLRNATELEERLLKSMKELGYYEDVINAENITT